MICNIISDANELTAGVASLVDTEGYPDTSKGSRNIFEYVPVLYSIAISRRKFKYCTTDVLFQCVWRIILRTLFARAVILPCHVHRRSIGFATIAVAFTKGEKIFGHIAVAGLV